MGMFVSTARLCAAAALCVMLAACGGGGGSGGGDNTAADTAPGSGTSSTGTPSADGGTPSTGGGTPSADSSTGGGATKANAIPTITGTPPPSALPDQQYVFQPSAADADGDVLSFGIENSPPWAAFDSASGTLQGIPSAGDVGSYGGIVISVTDGADDAALAAFTITVQEVGNAAVELSWQAPTENEDGSPLTDLAGFKIYWGTSPGKYTNTVTIDNPSVLSYLLENLVPNTYYFIATAFNVEGTESFPSVMATATL